MLQGLFRVMSAMKMYEVAEVEIGKDVTVENQEGLVERLPNERQRTDRSERLELLGIGDLHVPLMAVATDAANEVPQISSRDENLSNAVSSKPFEHEFEYRSCSNRHKGLW